MVTVIDYAVRKDSDGDEFVVLILQGDVTLVQSQSTGKFYATVYKTTMSTTFKEDVASKMVGKELPGEIVKIECVPYEYTNRETGEVETLSHTFQYVNASFEGAKDLEPSIPSNPTVPSFSKNGHMAMA